MTLENFFPDHDTSGNTITNDLFKAAAVLRLQELSEQTAEVKNFVEYEPNWSYAGPLESVRIGKGTGVYRIIYKPSGKTLSIGQGNLEERRQRHKSVFLNNGEDVVSPAGHVSPSQTAKKMFRYDTNLNNWYFSFCFIVKSLCETYEKILVKDEKPEFNLIHMAGK